MIRLFRGPAGAGKSTCLYRTVLDLAKKDKDINHILCVPEQFTLSAMRLIMEMSDESGILNIDILSFNRLSYRIFQDAGSGKYELLDDTAKNLIIRHIASERKKDLRVFGGNLKKQGYVSSVKSAISELMQYGCGLLDIDRMIEESRKDEPVLSLKLQDIRIIFEEFQKRLTTGYTTVEELYNVAAKKAQDAKFLKKARVFFDGFTGFTPVQYNLIESLYKAGCDIYVSVTDDDSLLPLFSTAAKTTDRFFAISGQNAVLEDINGLKIMRHKDNEAFTFLGENLFRRSKKKTACTKDIRFIKAADIQSETLCVLDHIRRLSVEEGIRYRQMAIILGDTSQYSDILKKEALRCGVPVYIDETRGIVFNPFSRFIKAALNCVSEDMSYEAVFNFLKTGLTGIDDTDIDLAENYIRAFKIRGMKRYQTPFEHTYRGIGEDDLSAANRVREALVGLLSPLFMQNNKASVKDYTRALYELGAGLDIQGKLKSASLRFEEENDTVRQMEFDQVYPLIMELYDRMVTLLGDEVTDIEEYSGIVEAGLCEIRVGTLPPSGDCVMAGDLTRSRFDEIEVLFVMGLCEEYIPGSFAKGGVISDADRRFLKDKSFELAPTGEENADFAAFYFYMNILKPTKKLFLSYPAVLREGGAGEPSFFMKEVMRLFDGAAFESFSEPENDGIFNRSDALMMLSKSFGEDDGRAPLLFKALENDSSAVRIVQDRFSKKSGMITKEAAQVIYTGTSPSVTELEMYAGCAYAHFLRYGLGLKEREEFEFDPSDMGSYLHDILKKYSDLVYENSLTFSKMDDKISDDLLVRAMEGSGSEKLLRLYESSLRNAYMKNRVVRIAKRTVDTLRYQSGEGAFIPAAFEKGFSYRGLKGFIDRIDRYEDGSDVYLNVIDYKSGRKEYDDERIYFGLDMQLVIYMAAALDMEKRSSGGKRTVHPAGLFYYHIDDPVIDRIPGMSDEEILSGIRKKLKLSGVVNKDGSIPQLLDKKLSGSGRSDVIPVRIKKDGGFDSFSKAATEEELKKVMERSNELADLFREEIKQGHIEKNPYELKKKNACEYCSYKAVCDGGEKRRLKKT